MSSASPLRKTVVSAAKHESSTTSEEAVKVICRVRPFNLREIDLHNAAIANLPDWERFPIRSVVEFSGNTCNFLDYEHDWVEKDQFVFDGCLWSIPDEVQRSENPYANQAAIFEQFGRDMLVQAWKGFNTCFFAYGQTGSGKTYSMMGEYEKDKQVGMNGEGFEDENSVKPDPGLIPRFCKTLFEEIKEKNEISEESKEDKIRTFRVSVQYLEIYNEQVKDLFWSLSGLSPEVKAKVNAENLKIRFNPTTGVFVEHLTSLQVTSWTEMMDLIDMGNNSRTTASTKMNERSSRSHAVFKVYLTQIATSLPKQKFEKPHEHIRDSCINLVDLAGSERNKKTGATGERLKEAANINKSLSTLKSVIDALVDNSTSKGIKKRIPYRDSHLTSILMDSLGGNSKTYMLVTVSPHADNADETFQTLKYGSKARQIISVVHVNENAAGRMMLDLEEELKRMREEMVKAEEAENSSEAVEDIRAQIAKQQEAMQKMEEELMEQQQKLAILQKESELRQKHRQWIALMKMEEMTKVSSATGEVAAIEAALRRQLDGLNESLFDYERNTANMENVIEASHARADDFKKKKVLTEQETDSLRKKMNRVEANKREMRRKSEESITDLAQIGRERINTILLHRLFTARNEFNHEEKLQNLEEAHENQIEAEQQKAYRQGEEFATSESKEVEELAQKRENMRANLITLQDELARVENERATQVEKLEAKGNNLRNENKKRREALTQRIQITTASYEKRYHMMVSTMEKQFEELMNGCAMRHEEEEKEQIEKLRQIRNKYEEEVEHVKHEWKLKIDVAIEKGKREFQSNKQRWQGQLLQREQDLKVRRRALREIKMKESESATFNRRVAARLERIVRPKGPRAKKYYELLELYLGLYQENRPNLARLESFLKEDVNPFRCDDPPVIGLELPKTNGESRCDHDELLRRPAMWAAKNPGNPPTSIKSPSPQRHRTLTPAIGRRTVSPTHSALFYPAPIRALSPHRSSNTPVR